MKTVDPLYVPTKDSAAGNNVSFDNTGCSSFTELLKISVSHQESQDSSAASDCPAVRNGAQQTESMDIVMCLCNCKIFKYLNHMCVKLEIKTTPA